MRKLAFVSVTLVGAVALSQAQPVVLYDGASGVVPHDALWNWNFQTIGSASTGMGSGFVTLDTTPLYVTYSGWGRLAPIPLNPTTGFQIRFDARVVSENHSAPDADKNMDGLADRAGLSLIALGTDLKGVEVAFWENEVWIQQQDPIFIHHPTLDRHFMDTTSQINSFVITVDTNGYALAVNGTTVLNGLSKDYSAWDGPINPYSTPNFLFFGDNTTSAMGQFEIAYVSVEAVPEPATLAALGAGLLLLRRRRNN